MPGRGRTLFIVLVSLAVLFTGIDFALRFWAERWLSGVAEDALDLPVEPDVQLSGFPFVLQVARGRFRTVGIEGERFVAEGMGIERVRLDLRDVRFSFGALISGDRDADITASSGDGFVEVTDDAVSERVQTEGIPVVVEFRDPEVQTTTTLSAGGREATATGTGALELRDGALAFRPESLESSGPVNVRARDLSFRLRLPVLLGGLTFEGVEVGEGTARVRFSLAESLLRLRVDEAAGSVSFQRPSGGRPEPHPRRRGSV